MTASPAWPQLLEQLLRGQDLQADQAEALMRGWLGGAIDPC